MIRIFAFLLWAASMIGFASQTTSTVSIVTDKDSNRKIKEYAQTNEATKPDFHGTQEVPFFVKVLPSENGQEIAYEKNRERDKDSNDKLIAYATCALAGITLFLAIYTALLWRSTSQMVKGAENASKMQLRAYVGVIKCEAEDKGVRIRYINSGATPARKLTSGAWSSDKSLTKKEIIAYAMKHISARQFTSDATAWKDIETSVFVKMDMEACKAVTTFVHGHIGYEDIFGEPQHVCVQAQMKYLNGWQFVIWYEGNEAT